jgi:DNA-binding GntR family transcriptional regulator
MSPIIDKSSLQIHAYDAIKEQILNKKLASDILYSETKLAAELGISRTPMRESLRRLSQEGYITIIPSKGFMLRQLTEKDMLETIQMRCAIEGFCTHIVADEINSKKAKKLLTALDALTETMTKARNTKAANDAFIAADHKFHIAIVAYVNNTEFNKAFQQLMYLVHLTTSNALSVPGRIDSTLDEHKQYVVYLKDGNGDAAYNIMIKHLMMPLNLRIL